MLRRAAERAEIEGRDSFSPGLVEDIADDAETEVYERNVQRLSTHQRILFDIVRESEEIAAGELHAEYEERMGNPKSKPTRRRYLQSLKRYELVEQVGRTRGTCYRYLEP
ncbi:hypothetical protein [Halorussus aquaticus]|uniref:Uncharacterized protein n=1 Tax=Halorussus aquaticus TaxID=2953748 RepID=A0ABD5QA50_9EURY|nr:hypothetical protein [Halorussus aquaticus]